MLPSSLLAQIAPETLAAGVGIGVVLLFAFAGLLCLALFALWIWMIADCAQSPEPPGNPNHRVTWILILLFTGAVGTLLYYFLVRQPRIASQRARSFSSPSLPPRPREE